MASKRAQTRFWEIFVNNVRHLWTLGGGTAAVMTRTVVGIVPVADHSDRAGFGMANRFCVRNATSVLFVALSFFMMLRT